MITANYQHEACKKCRYLMMKTSSVNPLTTSKLNPQVVLNKELWQMKNEELFLQIENLRLKMITVGLSKGFTSAETVRLSERLDRLINLQMGLIEELTA
jgi:hypothetical protein